jgi:hypothetical protein
VRSAGPIVAFAGSTASLLVFGGLVIAVMVLVAFLLTRGDGGSAYDRIGAGGISREGEYGGGASSAAPGPGSLAASSPEEQQGEREQEIRQLLSARSERLVRRGQPALDVEAELARLLAASSPHGGEDGEGAAGERDPQLAAEVRQLVLARNERRIRQGLEPLDVEAEVTRTLEELGS